MKSFYIDVRFFGDECYPFINVDSLSLEARL